MIRSPQLKPEARLSASQLDHALLLVELAVDAGVPAIGDIAPHLAQPALGAGDACPRGSFRAHGYCPVCSNEAGNKVGNRAGNKGWVGGLHL
jgi:hypothetical protein